MSDKPKRKNSPHRRRKFLLVLILLALLVSGGVAVLSPQIEAWLATDPFTPACENVENFKFLVYEQTYATDAESSFVETFTRAPDQHYEWHVWFDDQRYLIYMTDGGLSGAGYTATSIIDTEGDRYPERVTEIPDSIRYNVRTRSRQFLVKGSTFSKKVDVIDVFNHELLFREPLPFDPFRGFSISPDERYVLIYGDTDSSSYLFDIKTEELTELADLDVIGWFDDTQLVYQTTNLEIRLYDVETGKRSPFHSDGFVSESTSKNIENRLYVQSSDNRWIGFLDNDGNYWLWDRLNATSTYVQLMRGLLFSAKLREDYLIYNFRDKSGIYYFYELQTGDIQPHTSLGRRQFFSDSGRYIAEHIVRANSEYFEVTDIKTGFNFRIDGINSDLGVSNQAWQTLDGKDYLFYSVPIKVDNPMVRTYYLADPLNGNRCKIGVWDSLEEFGVG